VTNGTIGGIGGAVVTFLISAVRTLLTK
jgi:hypothetical protein